MNRRLNPRGIVWSCAFAFLVVFVLLYATNGLATHTVTKTEDIRNTKHYFVGNPDILATGTTEICIFCHTPHGANPNVTGQAPLWNRNIPIDTTFSTYKAPNLDSGTIDPTQGRPKGVSLACLSCHDGTIGIDAIINGPGSGGFIADNRNPGAPGISSSLLGFTGPGVDANSSMAPLASPDTNQRDSEEASTTPFSPFSGGIHDTVFDTGGSETDLGMSPFPNLTSNLSDDHPVGIEIPADGFTLSSVRDPQFAPIGANSPPPATDGETIKFITRSAGIYPNDIRDRIRAYPSTLEAGKYYVECATCHNPHTPRANFLRLPSAVPGLVSVQLDPTTPIDDGGIYNGEPWAQFPNNGSAICRTCHAK